DDGAELYGQTGDLRQHRVAKGVAADQSARGSERLEVVRVVRLQLVDDHVAHTDRPTTECHDEHGEERQDPVGDEAGDDRPGEVGPQRVNVATGHGEDPGDDAQTPCHQQRQPHVRGGGEDVTHRQEAVVEHLAA